MNGILPLNKPTGWTSHDCVHKMRKWSGQRKIGHTGTLDPAATGVLLLCFGTATKAVPYLTEDDKEYEATIVLGSATTTEDAEGEVIARKKVTELPSVAKIESVLSEWTGNIRQVPPMYSAVKVNGRKLYEYAREGIEVDRPERFVTIHALELMSDGIRTHEDEASFRVRVHCSKGTYIRTLAVDIGKSLGYPAHLTSLKRTRSGMFSLSDCLSLKQAERLAEDGELDDALVPLEKAFRAMPRWIVPADAAEKIKNGSVLPLPEEMKANRFTVYNEKGSLLAVYRRHPHKEGYMKPERVFPESD
ncbi:MAG TPA: tRNA pseudouridine(55) synthase TruB [Bacillales bacterium]|nr:tRNA pseudouridine(55) synthase TruB [Bacillales bacterium]